MHLIQEPEISVRYNKDVNIKYLQCIMILNIRLYKVTTVATGPGKSSTAWISLGCATLMVGGREQSLYKMTAAEAVVRAAQLGYPQVVLLLWSGAMSSHFIK